MARLTETLSTYALALLRLVAGLMFAFHGAQKLFGAFGGIGGSGATAAMFSLFWFGAVIELLGGSLIALGLFTRPVAFLLCGEMAFAYFRFHFPKGFLPIVNGGEIAVLYCFIFLFLFAKGPGGCSLDRIRGKAN